MNLRITDLGTDAHRPILRKDVQGSVILPRPHCHSGLDRVVAVASFADHTTRGQN